MRINLFSQRKSLIELIIILLVVGLIGGALYYYLSKEKSEVPETNEMVVGSLRSSFSAGVNNIFSNLIERLIGKKRGKAKICARVITPALNKKTNECREFPTPCDVPKGWEIVPACGQYFKIAVVDEIFTLYVTNPQEVKNGYDCYSKKRQACIPFGSLVRGDGDFNNPWSWHIRPKTAKFLEIAMEICDGKPSFVESDLEYWLNIVKVYCPWAGKIVAIGKNAPVK